MTTMRAALAPCVECDEGVGAVVALQKLISRSDRRTAICAKAAVIAIVQNNVAGIAAALVAVDLVHQACRDLVWGGLAPVAGHRVPGDGNEAKLPRKLENIRAASTEWRAEEEDGLSNDLGEDVVSPGQLFQNFGIGGSRKLGVTPGMISDQVTGFKHAPSQVSFGLNEAPHHEKRGAHIVFSKHIEKARRPGRIRTIVVGEGKLSRTARRNQGAAEQLRARPARCIRVAANA